MRITSVAPGIHRGRNRPTGIAAANVELATVQWRSADGHTETMEMTASPAARAYFEQVMAKEARN